jgi:hypothetical protein
MGGAPAPSARSGRLVKSPMVESVVARHRGILLSKTLDNVSPCDDNAMLVLTFQLANTRFESYYD